MVLRMARTTRLEGGGRRARRFFSAVIHVDNLPAPDHQGVEFLSFASFEGRTDLWADGAQRREPRTAAIEGVGLGEVAGGLGEVTHLAWIDGHSRELGGQEQREGHDAQDHRLPRGR